MDIITSVVLIILFIVIMVFSFSMGMLTPLIGKKEVGLVIIIGLILGAVGGVFFISPTIQGYPQAVGAVTQLYNGDHEMMSVEVESSSNINQIKSMIEHMDGVNNVSANGLVIHTQPFSDNISVNLNKNIQYMDDNISTWDIDNKAGTITLNLTNANTSGATKILKERLFEDYGINYSYSIIELTVDAKAGSVNQITQNLADNHIVVSSVNGPVHLSIIDAQKHIPSTPFVILVCAILGGIVATLGVFIDDIIRALSKVKWR
jgi:hypothetical protein